VGFRFLHAADVHLDSGFAGLPGETDSRLAGATRAAFAALVDLALAESVDFLLIAGDLYDGPWRDVGTAFFVRDQMRRLREGGIPAFLIKGNHDADSRVADSLPPPENLTVFPADRAATHRLEALGVAIHGRSFASRHVGEDFVRGYPAPLPGWFNIGLLHTSADGRPGHAAYAPCTVESLRAFGYDYWALGHVHAREVLAEAPPIVFPGCLQGRHPREPGAKGAMLVTVEGGALGLSFRPLDAVRWAAPDVALDGCETMADALAAMAAALRAELADAESRPVVARLRLLGATPLDGDLRAMGVAALREDAGRVALDLSGDLLVEGVRVATSPPAGADAVTLGPLAEALAQAVGAEAVRAALEADRTALLDRFPREALEAVDPLPDLADLLAEGRRLLLARGAVGGDAP
jgi:hypothetical protein